MKFLTQAAPHLPHPHRGLRCLRGGITLGMVAALIAISPQASAKPATKNLKLDGTVAEYKAKSFPASLKTVRFFAKSSADFTQTLGVSVQAPIGSVVSVQAVRTGAADVTKVRASSFYPIMMRRDGTKDLYQSFPIRPQATSSSRLVLSTPRLSTPTSFIGDSSTSSYYCCNFTKAMFDMLRPQFNLLYPNCDDECICEKFEVSGYCSAIPTPPGGGTSPGNNLPGSTPGNTGSDAKYYGSVLLEGAFQKDACAKGNDTSVLLVSVDLRKVKRNRLSSGLSIRVAAQEVNYQGSRAASIKPVSDGKYAPRPLLLMARAAPGREVVRVVRWKYGKPSSMKVYDNLDSAYYQGLSLMRVPVDLPGGWASVELVDTDNYSRGYAVCLEMARRRQRINGYPVSVRGD